MYGLPYGPMLFVANGVTMRLLGPSLASSKVAGCVAAAGSVLLLAIALRGALAPNRSVAAGADGSALSDIWRRQLLGARRTDAALLCRRRGAEPDRSSSARGDSRRHGARPGDELEGERRDLSDSGIGTAVEEAWVVGDCRHRCDRRGRLAAPFVVSDRFSASAYVYWLGSATSEGVRVQNLPTALEWAALLSVPMLMTAAGDRRAA